MRNTVTSWRKYYNTLKHKIVQKIGGWKQPRESPAPQYENIDVSHLKTVCFLLGPYRNLTTLTSALVALHPHCQVLNHASDRVLPMFEKKVICNYSEKGFEQFVKYAIHLSLGGERGQVGGSIIFSHAFDHQIIKEKFTKRYGTDLLKKDIRCFFWKDSIQVANFIRNNKVNLGDLLEQNDKIRFLMPIRNPMDCAISNLNTQHTAFLQGLQDFSVNSVLDTVLTEIAWFFDIRRKNPERFFYYFENEFNEKLVVALSGFLGIEPFEDLVRDTLECYQLKPSYEHAPQLIEQYQKTLPLYFKKHPKVREKLAAFT